MEGNIRQRGQASMEFALLIPVLLALLLGLVDLGRAYFVHVAVTDAAAEGLTYGVRHLADPGVEGAVKTRASEASEGIVEIEEDQVTFTSSSDAVTVTVTYQLELFTPLIGAMVPGGALPLEAVAVHSN